MPSVKIIQRTGEIDAFDYAEFVDAVEATGRKNLIIAGISTDVCLTFAALSAIDRGYNVHAIIDASGTWNDTAQTTSIARMAAAGVTMNSTVGITAELQRDWKNPTGEQLANLYADLAIPFYQTLMAMRS